MSDLPAQGGIPQSQALVEAGVDSLGELMSRDPEGYSKQDLERIVVAMRDQRERLAKSVAEATTKPKAKGPAATLQTAIKVGDLDL